MSRDTHTHYFPHRHVNQVTICTVAPFGEIGNGGHPKQELPSRSAWRRRISYRRWSEPPVTEFCSRLITNIHYTREGDSPRFVATGIYTLERMKMNDLQWPWQLPSVSLLAQWCPRFCAAATRKLISGLNLFICTIFNYFFSVCPTCFYSLVSLTRLTTPCVGTLNKIWIWIWICNENQRAYT